MIVSRKHYQEVWNTYPAVSLTELRSVLKLQKNLAGNNRVLQYKYQNKELDGFDVKTIHFSTKINDLVSKKIALIPETELLTATCNEKVIFDIDSPQGKLYCAKSNNKVLSAYQSQLLPSQEAFKLSAGYNENAMVRSLTNSQYATHLLESLQNIDFADLVKNTSMALQHIFTPRQLHQLYLGPVLTSLLFVLATNGYYYFKNENINNQLAGYDETVNKLLLMQTTQDQKNAFINIATTEFKNIPPKLEYWEIIYNAVSSGMHVQQFRKRDNTYLLRGKADDASEILAVINQLPMIKNAAFDGTVRKSRKKDSFIIKFEVDQEL
jgi:hypothetical protein